MQIESPKLRDFANLIMHYSERSLKSACITLIRHRREKHTHTRIIQDYPPHAKHVMKHLAANPLSRCCINQKSRFKAFDPF